ncbi:MAG: ABC transporter permease [Bdellovibrionota bacterium]
MELAFFKPLGIDFFCLGKKFLVFNLVSRNLKIKYRRSILGLFWTLLAPIAMAFVYYFVFQVILNIQVPHYLVFILSGILLWTFFSQTLMEGLESVVGNWGLISKVPIPLQIFPYVGTLTNLVTLLLSLPIIIGAAIIFKTPIGASMVLIPFYFFLLFIMAYSLSFIAGVAFVYFRDLRHLMGIVMQLWFYSTPVIYDENMIPPQYRWVIFLNPVGHIFTGMHTIFINGGWPSLKHASMATIWAIVALYAAILMKKYFFKEVVERI